MGLRRYVYLRTEKKKNNLLWSHRYLQNYANCMPTDHIHHAFELFLAICFFVFGWDNDSVASTRAREWYGIRDQFSACYEELLVNQNSFFEITDWILPRNRVLQPNSEIASYFDGGTQFCFRFLHMIQCN